MFSNQKIVKELKSTLITFDYLISEIDDIVKIYQDRINNGDELTNEQLAVLTFAKHLQKTYL